MTPRVSQVTSSLENFNWYSKRSVDVFDKWVKHTWKWVAQVLAVLVEDILYRDIHANVGV